MQCVLEAYLVSFPMNLDWDAYQYLARSPLEDNLFGCLLKVELEYISNLGSGDIEYEIPKLHYK